MHLAIFTNAPCFDADYWDFSKMESETMPIEMDLFCTRRAKLHSPWCLPAVHRLLHKTPMENSATAQQSTKNIKHNS